MRFGDTEHLLQVEFRESVRDFLDAADMARIEYGLAERRGDRKYWAQKAKASDEKARRDWARVKEVVERIEAAMKTAEGSAGR